ncbi:hypothetical protein AAO25_23835, partial [Salmonella enterica subsp. enterica]|nr:hypothetical protein [Salmonella enterica subsp. enterica]
REQETRYRYDNRDQITSVLRLNADGPAQEERYRYTVNEQIAESRINGILSQHDYRNECVTQAGDSRYEYDACGRVIKRTEQKRGFRPQEWRYRWDDFDRLREVKTPDGEVWQYRYDAFGRRTAKRNIIRATWKQNHHTVSEVRYQWLGMALSASEKRYADGSPALREQWHYRGGFELLAKEARAANDDTSDFYPILIGPDGAPQEMYSANGRKVWRRQRSLWGLAAANDASHNARESCDAGFMGQWQDEESGLWYNLHRYMDSATGQYLSPDPLKLGGGLNTQSYVHNPVGWCDPWGLLGCPTLGPRTKTVVNNKGDAPESGGVYKFRDSEGNMYTGSTDNFQSRMNDHLASGNLPEGGEVTFIPVEPGTGRTAHGARRVRRFYEQMEIGLDANGVPLPNETSGWRAVSADNWSTYTSNGVPNFNDPYFNAP